MTSSSMRAGQLRNFSGGVVRSRTSPSFFLDPERSRKNKNPGRDAVECSREEKTGRHRAEYQKVGVSLNGVSNMPVSLVKA